MVTFRLITCAAFLILAVLPAKAQVVLAGKKVLIVYLSRTNNTKVVAEIIKRKTGGTLVALKLKQPYPADYQTTVKQVEHENQTNFLPPLKTHIENIDQYQIIFIGFPTWGMQLPPPVKSFLQQYNLSGKTVVPFNTNAGYGAGSSFAILKTLSRGAKVLVGLSFKGGIERDGVLLVMKGKNLQQAQTDVEQWLQKLKLL